MSKIYRDIHIHGCEDSLIKRKPVQLQFSFGPDTFYELAIFAGDVGDIRNAYVVLCTALFRIIL